VLRSKAKIQWPWFILFFCLAALMNTTLPSWGHVFSIFNWIGKIGLTVTLFLIGTGLNKRTIDEVGVRPLLQGLLLWAVVGVATLVLVLLGWIHV